MEFSLNPTPLIENSSILDFSPPLPGGKERNDRIYEEMLRIGLTITKGIEVGLFTVQHTLITHPDTSYKTSIEAMKALDIDQSFLSVPYIPPEASGNLHWRLFTTEAAQITHTSGVLLLLGIYKHENGTIKLTQENRYQIAGRAVAALSMVVYSLCCHNVALFKGIGTSPMAIDLVDPKSIDKMNQLNNAISIEQKDILQQIKNLQSTQKPKLINIPPPPVQETVGYYLTIKDTDNVISILEQGRDTVLLLMTTNEMTEYTNSLLKSYPGFKDSLETKRINLDYWEDISALLNLVTSKSWKIKTNLAIQEAINKSLTSILL